MRKLKQFFGGVTAVLVIAVFALAALMGVLSLRQSSAVRDYRAQGFEMVKGCNGGAAVQADGQVIMIEQHLEEFGASPDADTNIVTQLRSALVVAREKARVLSEDCRRRGHRETYPWKTDWNTVNQALAAAEKLYR